VIQYVMQLSIRSCMRLRTQKHSQHLSVRQCHLYQVLARSMELLIILPCMRTNRVSLVMIMHTSSKSAGPKVKAAALSTRTAIESVIDASTERPLMCYFQLQASDIRGTDTNATNEVTDIYVTDISEVTDIATALHAAKN